MSVTVKDICKQFGVGREAVRQIGSKQLFIVDAYRDTYPSCQYNNRILVSYWTIIGVFDNLQWNITTKKHSPTISKQITQFRRETPFDIVMVDEDVLRDMLAR
jgi:hypothetical protein